MSRPKIWLSSPHMGGNEIKFVHKAFDDNYIAPLGPNVDGFEGDISSFTGVRNVAALSSGTAAIHLALILAGVGRGDEVICQTFTFSASANPIIYQGATPIFIDSEPNTWNMCPDALEEAIKDRLSRGKPLKAVIPVHLYGMPAQMDRIKSICTQYNLIVIEDAAEALGSTYQGRAMGTFGDMGVFSFNGNKIITTSGGGALVSEREDWIQEAKNLSTQARDAAPHYQHSKLGFNYRMSNVSAGIGRGQMEVLSERVKQRRAVYAYYQSHLSKIAGIAFQPESVDSYSNRWLTGIVFEGFDVELREGLRVYLEKENIETRPLWKPMHLQPYFSSAPYYGDRLSEKYFEKGLCLPSGSNLSMEDLSLVVEKIQSYLTIK